MKKDSATGYYKVKPKMSKKDKRILDGFTERLYDEISMLGVGKKKGISWDRLRNYLTDKIGIIQ